MKSFQIVIEGTFEGEGESVADVTANEINTATLLERAGRSFVGHLGEGAAIRRASLTVDYPAGHHAGAPAVVDLMPLPPVESAPAPVAAPSIPQGTAGSDGSDAGAADGKGSAPAESGAPVVAPQEQQQAQG